MTDGCRRQIAESEYVSVERTHKLCNSMLAREQGLVWAPFGITMQSKFDKVFADPLDKTQSL